VSLDEYAVQKTHCVMGSSSRHKGSFAVDRESTSVILPVRVSALVSLQCYDTVGWTTGRACGWQKYLCQVLREQVEEDIKQRSS